MNNRELRIVLAGFGGQGVLFAGKVIASAGLIEDRELSWLPSYGPEMRGGTANCSVCLSDDPIGSPLVLTPNVLIAMNQPSFDKFIDTVVDGGLVIIDSTLVPNVREREGVTICSLPAQKLAEENEIKGLGNIILVGKLFEQTGFCDRETLDTAIDKCVPARKKEMVAFNKKALEIGMNN
jgi:2-oxoglutarate ferredoxin oxidoreductase subunit gamma